MSATKPVRIAFNMLCCATLFCWAKPWPRETISGLFGRKYEEGVRAANKSGRVVPQGLDHFWIAGFRFIDRLHPNEEFHCHMTSVYERRARKALGYHE